MPKYLGVGCDDLRDQPTTVANLMLRGGRRTSLVRYVTSETDIRTECCVSCEMSANIHYVNWLAYDRWPRKMKP